MNQPTTNSRQRIEISVLPRTPGKHFSRGSRDDGKVPAIVYGPKMQPYNVLADEITVKRYTGHRFESTIFALKSDIKEVNSLPVILRDVQVHPVTRRPLHVDFYAPDMSKPVRVKVELRLEGKPEGLTSGGLLEHLLRELEIEVLPANIPESIVADVSALDVGDALHVSDLQVPEGVRVISLKTLTIATVAIPKEEVAPVITAAAAEGAAAPAAGAATPAAGAAAAAAPAAAGGDKKK